MWAMYKLVRCREEHTGGGDGDDETDLEEGDDNDDDGGDDNGDGKKRKWPTVKRVRFSKRVLDMFETSAFYKIINKV